MEPERIRVLIVEDSPVDAPLAQEMLEEIGAGRYECVHVGRLDTAEKYLSREHVDIVLLDPNLPDSSGVETLDRVVAVAPDIPLIVVTGLDDTDAGLSALQAGAQEYLIKGRFNSSSLARVISYTLERHRLLQRLRDAVSDARATERSLRQVIDSNLDGIVIVDSDGVIRMMNSAARDFFGPQAEVGKPLPQEIPGSGRCEIVSAAQSRVARTGEVRVTHVELQGQTLRLAAVRDITERKEMEERMRVGEEELRAIYDSAPLMMIVLDSDCKVYKANRFARELLRESLDDLSSQGPGDALRCVHALGADGGCGHAQNCGRCPLRQAVLSAVEDGLPVDRREVTLRVERQGRVCESRLLVSVNRLGVETSPMSLLCIEDVTERKNLEEQLNISQRLEAIGRLAGGVAHDFNNLLTGIAGYTDLVMLEVDRESGIYSDLANVRKLARSASSLTAQLMAFARKQALEPVVVDINSLVKNTSDMLERIIGEDIKLEAHLDPEAGNMRVDPSKIEQVLMNLAINARDAMPEGGRLTLETGRTTIDEIDVRLGTDLRTGDYVVLTVSDTGHGMDDVTAERAFEPFFTTKGVGKGTGLGLATVYGICRQHGGSISVRSKPGDGATFRILLPAEESRVSRSIDRSEFEPHPSEGHETVLVVDDEIAIRAVARRVLARHGYNVLVAQDCRHAREIVRQNMNGIDLLLADVVLPDCSGPELYEELSGRMPDLPVIFMSGYTDDQVARKRLTANGYDFLPKPFDSVKLASCVRAVLDRQMDCRRGRMTQEQP